MENAVEQLRNNMMLASIIQSSISLLQLSGLGVLYIGIYGLACSCIFGIESLGVDVQGSVGEAFGSCGSVQRFHPDAD